MANTEFSSLSGSAIRLNSRSFQNLGKQLRLIGQAATEIGETVTSSQREQTKALFASIGLPMPSFKRASSCRMPECCDTADTYLGRLSSELDRPEVARFTVNLRNDDCVDRTYQIEAPKRSDNDNEPQVVVTPTSVVLEPGESQEVQILVDASKSEYGTSSCSTVKVTGKDCMTQFLEVCVDVVRPNQYVPTIDLHCICKTDMRPKKWYHHYYCDPPKTKIGSSADLVEAELPSVEVGRDIRTELDDDDERDS